MSLIQLHSALDIASFALRRVSGMADWTDRRLPRILRFRFRILRLQSECPNEIRTRQHKPCLHLLESLLVVLRQLPFYAS